MSVFGTCPKTWVCGLEKKNQIHCSHRKKLFTLLVHIFFLTQISWEEMYGQGQEDLESVQMMTRNCCSLNGQCSGICGKEASFRGKRLAPAERGRK